MVNLNSEATEAFINLYKIGSKIKMQDDQKVEVGGMPFEENGVLFFLDSNRIKRKVKDITLCLITKKNEVLGISYYVPADADGKPL